MITTVANVVNLYYDLVTFNDDLKIKQQTLDLDTQALRRQQGAPNWAPSRPSTSFRPKPI